jgi:hypothetical protein
MRCAEQSSPSSRSHTGSGEGGRDENPPRPRYARASRSAKGVSVTVNNQATPGYIIRLDNPPEAIPGTTIDHEANVNFSAQQVGKKNQHAEVIPARPTELNTAGAVARDLDAERRANERPRVIRP